jgi:hypothetical protein
MKPDIIAPKVGRQINIPGMAYAPTSELGVVFLFGRLAPRLGFCVETVRPQFPDCIATRRGRRYLVEFELWASDYHTHRHAHDGCETVVCWENDWEDRPKKYRNLEIISLKSYVGALPRVFTVGCRETESGHQLTSRTIEWNIPASAQIGDLVLMYRSAPTSAFYDAWRIVGPFQRYGKRNKEGFWPGRQAGLRLVARFQKPLTYMALARDPRTRDTPVIRRRFQGKSDITEDWPLFHDQIVELNPKAKRSLRPYLVDLRR